MSVVSALERRKQSLMRFYQKYDPGRIKNIDPLFEHFSFGLILEAIKKKYKRIPEDWEYERFMDLVGHVSEKKIANAMRKKGLDVSKVLGGGNSSGRAAADRTELPGGEPKSKRNKGRIVKGESMDDIESMFQSVPVSLARASARDSENPEFSVRGPMIADPSQIRATLGPPPGMGRGTTNGRSTVLPPPPPVQYSPERNLPPVAPRMTVSPPPVKPRNTLLPPPPPPLMPARRTELPPPPALPSNDNIMVPFQQPPLPNTGMRESRFEDQDIPSPPPPPMSAIGAPRATSIKGSIQSRSTPPPIMATGNKAEIQPAQYTMGGSKPPPPPMTAIGAPRATAVRGTISGVKPPPPPMTAVGAPRATSVRNGNHVGIQHSIVNEPVPDLTKYKMMLKNGLPEPVVRNALQRDGLSPDLFASIANPSGEKSNIGLPIPKAAASSSSSNNAPPAKIDMGSRANKLAGLLGHKTEAPKVQKAETAPKIDMGNRANKLAALLGHTDAVVNKPKAEPTPKIDMGNRANKLAALLGDRGGTPKPAKSSPSESPPTSAGKIDIGGRSAKLAGLLGHTAEPKKAAPSMADKKAALAGLLPFGGGAATKSKSGNGNASTVNEKSNRKTDGEDRKKSKHAPGSLFAKMHGLLGAQMGGGKPGGPVKKKTSIKKNEAKAKAVAAKFGKKQDLKVLPISSPEYDKYRKMQKMKLPEGAIRNCLEKDGFDPEGFFSPAVEQEPIPVETPAPVEVSTPQIPLTAVVPEQKTPGSLAHTPSVKAMAGAVNARATTFANPLINVVTGQMNPVGRVQRQNFNQQGMSTSAQPVQQGYGVQPQSGFLPQDMRQGAHTQGFQNRFHNGQGLPGQVQSQPPLHNQGYQPNQASTYPQQNTGAQRKQVQGHGYHQNPSAQQYHGSQGQNYQRQQKGYNQGYNTNHTQQQYEQDPRGFRQTQMQNGRNTYNAQPGNSRNQGGYTQAQSYQQPQRSHQTVGYGNRGPSQGQTYPRQTNHQYAQEGYGYQGQGYQETRVDESGAGYNAGVGQGTGFYQEAPALDLGVEGSEANRNGWTVQWSEEYNRPYYFNTKTGASTWVAPPGM